MTSKPTIVLITGAFHLASAMDLLSAQLEQAGYKAHCMGLTTVNRPDHTIKDDVEAIMTTCLNPLIVEEGNDVVLYLHSYAGFSGSVAIAGFSKRERSAKGQAGGIIGLIYQSAFIPREGDTQLEMVGGTFPAWQAPDTTTRLTSVPNPKQPFYADVPEPLATTSSQKIYPHSIKAFTAPSPAVHYTNDAYNHRRTYIHTSNDEALPPFAQDAFVERSGVEWDVRRMETGHSPLLSAPRELAGIVEEAVRGFVGSL